MKPGSLLQASEFPANAGLMKGELVSLPSFSMPVDAMRRTRCAVQVKLRSERTVQVGDEKSNLLEKMKQRTSLDGERCQVMIYGS